MTKFLLHIPLLVGLLLVPGLAWADFQTGYDAFERGDYETAFKEWRPLAELGDAWVQVLLGTMYRDGAGVPQDDQEAAKWYRRVAEQGDAEGQNNLGHMYEHGKGAPKAELPELILGDKLPPASIKWTKDVKLLYQSRKSKEAS